MPHFGVSFPVRSELRVIFFNQIILVFRVTFSVKSVFRVTFLVKSVLRITLLVKSVFRIYFFSLRSVFRVYFYPQQGQCLGWDFGPRVHT